MSDVWFIEMQMWTFSHHKIVVTGLFYISSAFPANITLVFNQSGTVFENYGTELKMWDNQTVHISCSGDVDKAQLLVSNVNQILLIWIYIRKILLTWYHKLDWNSNILYSLVYKYNCHIPTSHLSN